MSSAKANIGALLFALILIPSVISSTASSSGSMHKLNNSGDKESPYLTPLRISISISTNIPSFAFIFVLHFLYIFIINSISGVEIPFLARQGLIAVWSTVSNAFQMSTIVFTAFLPFTLFQGCIQKLNVYLASILGGKALLSDTLYDAPPYSPVEN